MGDSEHTVVRSYTTLLGTRAYKTLHEAAQYSGEWSSSSACSLWASDTGASGEAAADGVPGTGQLKSEEPPTTVLVVPSLVTRTSDVNNVSVVDSAGCEVPQRQESGVPPLPPFVKAVARFLNDSPPRSSLLTTRLCNHLKVRGLFAGQGSPAGVGSPLREKSSETLRVAVAGRVPLSSEHNANSTLVELCATATSEAGGGARTEDCVTREGRPPPQPQRFSSLCPGVGMWTGCLPTPGMSGATSARARRSEQLPTETAGILCSAGFTPAELVECQNMPYTFGVPGVCCGLPRCALCSPPTEQPLQPVG